MHKKQKVIILLLVSWTGALILGLSVLFKLPEFYKEKQNLQTLYAQLSNREALQNRMKTFLDKFKYTSQQIKSKIATHEKIIADNSFKINDESHIPDFINNLQQLFADSDTSLINLGYDKRSYEQDLVIFPFNVEFRAAYQSMRRLLHALETNEAGIKIDDLEFISLNDSEHKIRLKAHCTVRFKKVGQ